MQAREGTTATLRFQHSSAGSGVARSGHIRPGGLIRVEYDEARLPPTPATATTEVIICHVQFVPGGERASGGMLDGSSGMAKTGSPRRPAFEARVPVDATRVEVWFEGRGPTGSSGWDSRSGQNYSFAVLADGLPVPEPAVAARPGAVVDRTRIHVVEDAATKEATRVGAGGQRLNSGLIIRALVAEASAATDVWADLHVFDAADELIHTGSVPLGRPAESVPDAPFVWEDDVYQGSGGGSGVGVWSRPDAHTIQYRLYCATRGLLFTDGVLHEFELPADHEVGAT